MFARLRAVWRRRPLMVLTVVAIILMVGIVAAIDPARRRLRVHAVEALRNA